MNPINPRLIWIPPGEACCSPAWRVVSATRADVKAGMHGKIHNKFREVDVTIAAKFGGVFSKQWHQANRPFEEPARENVIVKSTRP